MEKMNDKLKEKLGFLDVMEMQVRFLVGESKIKPSTERKLPTNTQTARNQTSRLRNAVKNMEIRLKMKDDNKTVALGTSKINYMDPRITVAWCKHNEIPIEKIFPKTLRGKFIWAMYCEPDWKF